VTVLERLLLLAWLMLPKSLFPILVEPLATGQNTIFKVPMDLFALPFRSMPLRINPSDVSGARRAKIEFLFVSSRISTVQQFHCGRVDYLESYGYGQAGHRCESSSAKSR
jgi:hypothetical protein